MIERLKERSMRRLRRGQRGAAAVEFALVLPLLMLLVLGTIDWGFYFFIEQVATNAAREGARVGAVVGDATAADPCAGVETAATTAVNRYVGMLRRTPTVTVVCPYTGAARTSCGTAVAASSLPSSVLVTVSLPAGAITGFYTMVPGTACAEAVMRLE